MTYYKLTIEKTSKSGRNDYSLYYTENKEFETVKAIKEYLKEQYFYCKTKRPIYVDDKEGKTKKIGYIYCYKDKDFESKKTIYCQEWVTIRKYEVLDYVLI